MKPKATLRSFLLFAAAALLWLGASSAHASLVLQLQASNYNQSTGTWTATVGSNATQGTAANRPTLVSTLTPNGSSAGNGVRVQILTN
jgi:hypothetical protein